MVKASGIDRTLLTVALLLIAIGFLMIFSTTTVISREKYGGSFHFLNKQLLFLALGLLVFLFLVLYRTPFYLNPRLVMAMMALAFTGLSLVFFFEKVNSTSRWIRIAGLSLQPSEFAKIALVLYLAMMLSRREAEINNLKSLGLLLLPVAFMEGLILKEPDFGNFVLIGVITMVMLFIAGLRLKYFAVFFLLLVPLLALLIQISPMRQDRIRSFLNPENYAATHGFQAMQSTYAVGSGGLFGQGIGNSTQKLFYLPYAYSDFVFAIIAEEMGFIGALAVIALFVIYYLRGTVIARQSDNPHTYLLVTGLVTLIVFQSMMNISVAVGLFPTKGIPLPFISSGGTSLLSSLIITGIILNVSRQRKVVFTND
ncbi:MAG: putative lipid II flippase FtsW [Acidobacteria bacterium]|jgi:cell division protein FtsW|nr:putative lipid II flippase FtsW [Acidobacteriota bacterium]